MDEASGNKIPYPSSLKCDNIGNSILVKALRKLFFKPKTTTSLCMIDDDSVFYKSQHYTSEIKKRNPSSNFGPYAAKKISFKKITSWNLSFACRG